MNSLFLFLLAASYNTAAAQQITGFQSCSSGSGSPDDMLQLGYSDPTPFDVAMPNGFEFINDPATQAKLESINATGGEATYYRCSVDRNGKSMRMLALCDDTNDCLAVSDYNEQPCGSASLCQTDPVARFEVDCSGIDETLPSCALNMCTGEGTETCFLAAVTTAPTAAADSAQESSATTIIAESRVAASCMLIAGAGLSGMLL